MLYANYKHLICMSLFGLTVMSANVNANVISDGKSVASLEEIRDELASVPSDVRARMSREQMTRYVSNYMVDTRLATEARSKGLDKDPRIKKQIDKMAREILARAVLEDELNRLANTLPDLEKLARERYEIDINAYRKPEAVRTSHILLRVSEENPELADAVVKIKATELLDKLKSGANFAELARAHSDDSGSAARGGELQGWSDRGTLVPPYEKAAYELKPGELSGLVRSRFGYHIIKLHEYRPASVYPYDEVKEIIIDKLRGQLIGQQRQDILKQYLGSRPVVLDDAAYEALKKN